MDLNIKGRTAFITGAGQGVGRRIALQFAGEGCNVAVNDFFAERAAAVAAEIEAAGGRAVAAVADITDRAQVESAVRAAEDAFGGVDILVNNAGVTVARRSRGGVPPTFLDGDPEEWPEIIGLNVFGMLNCSHRVLGGMRERRWGRIVNIMSEAGRAGEARLAVYAAAKAAMLGFAKSIAQEHARDGITVNAVALGAVAHEGIRSGPLSVDAMPATDERLAKMLTAYPVGRALNRLCRPEDIAPLVCLLASDMGAYITGQSVGVNGGFYMQ